MIHLVKTRERFMGIGQVLTMPLFFASNAIYPLSLIPPWLRAVSEYNPPTSGQRAANADGQWHRDHLTMLTDPSFNIFYDAGTLIVICAKQAAGDPQLDSVVRSLTTPNV